MKKSSYEASDLLQYQELINTWLINDVLSPVKFDELRFYHEDPTTGFIDYGARGSIFFNPEENTINVDYSFCDDSFDEINWRSSFFLYEYQIIEVDDVSSDIYVILSFNSDSTIAFFAGDAESNTKILVYLKYWNHLRTIKRKGTIKKVENAVTVLNNNNEIKNALKNFIEMLPLDVFTNFYVYTCLNIRKYDIDDHLIGLFDDCSEQMKHLSLKIVYDTPSNEETLNDIFNVFLSFRNIMRQYIPTEEELKDSVIKLLIRAC